MSNDNQIETYQSLAVVADHLHRKGQHRTGKSDIAWFVGKRTTWDAQNPIRVVPHEDGGYQVAVVIDGRYCDADDAQRAANLQRHLLNLVWLDQFSGPEAERMRDEEVERYSNWRVGPDDETGR